MSAKKKIAGKKPGTKRVNQKARSGFTPLWNRNSALDPHQLASLNTAIDAAIRKGLRGVDMDGWSLEARKEAVLLLGNGVTQAAAEELQKAIDKLSMKHFE